MTQYLIAHIGHTNRQTEHIIWWKPDSRSYTICIDKAGLYSEAEAARICQSGLNIAVVKGIVSLVSKSTPFYRRSDGTLARLYDGNENKVVPNSRDVWTFLMTERLMCLQKPDKPTPIGAKSRAIYLPDGVTIPLLVGRVGS